VIALKLAAFEPTLWKIDGLNRRQGIVHTGSAEKTGEGPIGNQNPMLSHDASFRVRSYSIYGP
jgi:hypothetical protein